MLVRYVCSYLILHERWSDTSFQTCVAPDYVLIPKDGEEDFITALRETYVDSRSFSATLIFISA